MAGDDKKILISFLCLSFNHEKFIDDCIRAIWRQDIKPEDAEIVFLDDGSSDNSVAVAEKLSKISPIKMKDRKSVV
jgi:alpha-1,3-rhamnosyltransferase